MRPRRDSDAALTISASVARHLAFAPVGFAVTEGPAHELVYTNAVFRAMQSSGQISIGAGSTHPLPADLMPILDGVFASAETVRDALLTGADGKGSWNCSVWPVPAFGANAQKLVIEVRDAEVLVGAKRRQREVTERLLLSALREQEVADEAVRATGGARYLAKASRDLSMSLDEAETRDTVRKLTLPRPGTWCIVDVVESNGAIHRLAVVHPDPSKQALARALEVQLPSKISATLAAESAVPLKQPAILTDDSGRALMLAAHGEENLRILRQIGFGSLLVVPLIVRARVQGAITFVSREGDAEFSSDEIALAVDVAARCAMALDNARLYREADALKLAAELANKTKSEFLGSMSHELRTPLNAIGGFTELIDAGIEGEVTDRQHFALARIKANQQHLLGLITEILNFVRIESGRMEYHHVAMSMADALADVVEMLRAVIVDRGMVIDGPHSTTQAMAWADANRVRQILVNLVMNAVKYGATKGGAITLRCGEEGGHVFAQVIDSGAGIEPAKLETIFEPFVQLTAGLKDRQGGVGLGLAISRDLARAMDGDLVVHSTPGVGTRFTLTLPKADSPISSPAERGERETASKATA